MNSERHFYFFVYARILVLFVFLLVSLLLHFKDPDAADFAFSSGIIRLLSFSFVFSLISHFLLKISKFRFFITYLQSIWDVLFVTLLLLFTGGIQSPYSFLYLLSIMNAGLLLGRREALYTASLCGILYGALVDFHYFGLLEPIGLLRADAMGLGEAQLFYTIFLNLLGYGIAAFITGYLAENARKSEVALEERNIDYNELNELNNLIVNTIDTGLITISTDGTIRVFNSYMERLTGLTQLQVYQKGVALFFPDIPELISLGGEKRNGEFKWVDKYLVEHLLSYTITLFKGGKKNISGGWLITLRDITELRHLEESLSKRDRMALLGELSARMAHEIRNPLASMSGAVQMLSEQSPADSSEQRLLTIMLRESSRLNALITEFLLYARPPEPVKSEFLIRPLIEELMLQLSFDLRFSKVSFRNIVPATIMVKADAAQLRQVFLNLISNSADAMPDGGQIEIKASCLMDGAEPLKAFPSVLITLTDNGAGLTEDTLSHLFEPFWTTKSNGTGLGLATSYRIIEAHGGKLTLENLKGGGCRCSILFPL